jgi:hypothetical protein
VPGQRDDRRPPDVRREVRATLEQAPKVVGGAGGNKDSAIEMSATDGNQQTSEEGDHEIARYTSLCHHCNELSAINGNPSDHRLGSTHVAIRSVRYGIAVVSERVRRLVRERDGWKPTNM